MKKIINLIAIAVVVALAIKRLINEKDCYYSESAESTQIKLKISALSTKMSLIKINSRNLTHFLMATRGGLQKEPLTVDSERGNGTEGPLNSSNGQSVEFDETPRTNLNYQIVDKIEKEIMHQYMDLLSSQRILNRLSRQLNLSKVDRLLYIVEGLEIRTLSSIGAYLKIFKTFILFHYCTKAFQTDTLLIVYYIVLAFYIFTWFLFINHSEEIYDALSNIN